MDPETAAVVAEIAAGCSHLMDLGKWAQNRLRGIDWEERPAA